MRPIRIDRTPVLYQPEGKYVVRRGRIHYISPLFPTTRNCLNTVIHNLRTRSKDENQRPETSEPADGPRAASKSGTTF